MLGVAAAGVLHGVHGPALYAAAPAAYVGGHAGHGDEGFDYYVSEKIFFYTFFKPNKKKMKNEKGKKNKNFIFL